MTPPPWVTPKGPFVPIFEVEEFKNAVEPADVYSARYSRHVSELSPAEAEDIVRYMSEVFSYFDSDSSLLVFGAGHSCNSNEFSKHRSIRKTVAWDFVEASSIGLDPNIGFCNKNILNDTIEGEFDYTFSSHTLEHFTREELLTIVIPKLLKATSKALVVVVPYGSNWEGEPTHKCRFYENDELAKLCSKYKKIRGGVEIVYWIDAVGAKCS